MISTSTQNPNPNSAKEDRKSNRISVNGNSYCITGTTGLPHLVNSFYNNYRDKTLSLNRNKRFVINNSKSVFKFKENDRLLGKIKLSAGNIQLAELKSKKKALADELSDFNTKNSNLTKKLNLIKFISRTKSVNQISALTNNYFQECKDFNQKARAKRDKLTSKLDELNTAIEKLKKETGALDKQTMKNKLRYVQLRAKHQNYHKLRKTSEECEKKSRHLKKKLENEKVVFETHKITLNNEKVQLKKLQVEIARYIINNPECFKSDVIKRLVFEAKSMEMRKKDVE